MPGSGLQALLRSSPLARAEPAAQDLAPEDFHRQRLSNGPASSACVSCCRDSSRNRIWSEHEEAGAPGAATMIERPAGVAELVRLYAQRALSRRQFLAGLSLLGVAPIPRPIQEQPSQGNYVVLVVIDGARPSYLTLASLPHIGALMEQGVVYEQAWVGELESVTPSVHATLGTGTLPRQNGFLGFGWVQPGTRKQVDFRALLAEGKIDPVLQHLAAPSVAARLEQLIPGAVALAASGHKNYAVVGLGGGAATYQLYGQFVGKEYVPRWMHARPPLTGSARRRLTIKSPIPIGGEDAWAFQYVLSVIRTVRPRLLMLNLPEVDTWGHWYGPDDSALFRKLLLNIDRGIGAIRAAYEQLGVLDRTSFIVTADHAMLASLPIHGWTETVRAAAQAEHAAAARIDGTTGAVWLENPAQAKAVAERLVTMHPPHVNAVFYRSAAGLSYHYTQASPVGWLSSAGAAGALQNLVDTTAGQHGPDLWVVFQENFTAAPRNVSGQWRGTHGGATWQAQHIPLILAGPAIRRGVRSSFPARSIDIAPTMEALLGLPPIQRPGVILADALTNPTSPQVAAQEHVSAGLQADVSALQEQSLNDVLRLIRLPHVPVFPPPAVSPPQGTAAGLATCE